MASSIFLPRGSGQKVARIDTKGVCDADQSLDGRVRIAGLHLLPQPPVDSDPLARVHDGQAPLTAQAQNVCGQTLPYASLGRRDSARHCPTVGGTED